MTMTDNQVARADLPLGDDGNPIPRIEHDLLCELEQRPDAISYDPRARRGRLYTVDWDRCDQSGCAAFFTRFDPHVQVIETFSGGLPDMVYFRCGDGRWGGRDRSAQPWVKWLRGLRSEGVS